MSVTIYHNPRCSKSRTTLGILQKLDVEVRVIEYLKTPPDSNKLAEILNLLGQSPRDFMRKGEAVYKQPGLNSSDRSEEDLIAAMVEHPILIERPIVLANGKAIVGRPPTRVFEIV